MERKTHSHSHRNVHIASRLMYLDTVCMWIARYLEQWERDALESLCRGLIYRPNWGRENGWMWLRGYQVRLILQQPTDEAFHFLSERICGLPTPLINRLDCS